MALIRDKSKEELQEQIIFQCHMLKAKNADLTRIKNKMCFDSLRHFEEEQLLADQTELLRREREKLHKDKVETRDVEIQVGAPNVKMVKKKTKVVMHKCGQLVDLNFAINELRCQANWVNEIQALKDEIKVLKHFRDRHIRQRAEEQLVVQECEAKAKHHKVTNENLIRKIADLEKRLKCNQFKRGHSRKVAISINDPVQKMTSEQTDV